MTGEAINTFYPRIEILDNAYEIHQLGRTRRIAVLLPHNYYQTDKKYPVLYLHDGQNLFDEYAPYGNWGVDKSLEKLARSGFGDVIIVAIDHGGVLRIQEYLPYSTPRYTEAEGHLYLKFMLEDLKPMIDNKYRVLRNREATGIGGSSLGGLISQDLQTGRADRYLPLCGRNGKCQSLWTSAASRKYTAGKKKVQ